MPAALTVMVSEAWQYDALTLSPSRRTEGAARVGKVPERPGACPSLSLGFIPNEGLRGEPEPAGITIQVDVARALYEALGRHFGDHQDPASRELVDVLKGVQAREAERVDLLLGRVTQHLVTDR